VVTPGTSCSVTFTFVVFHIWLKLTFALDKNPPGSIFTGSNYGEPDAKIKPQGSGEKYEDG
jgi:hypothetical protein